MGVLTSSGIGLGSAIAVTISWSVNNSILWAILHGALSSKQTLDYDATPFPLSQLRAAT